MGEGAVSHTGMHASYVCVGWGGQVDSALQSSMTHRGCAHPCVCVLGARAKG